VERPHVTRPSRPWLMNSASPSGSWPRKRDCRAQISGPAPGMEMGASRRSRSSGCRAWDVAIALQPCWSSFTALARQISSARSRARINPTSSAACALSWGRISSAAKFPPIRSIDLPLAGRSIPTTALAPPSRPRAHHPKVGANLQNSSPMRLPGISPGHSSNPRATGSGKPLAISSSRN